MRYNLEETNKLLQKWVLFHRGTPAY